MKSFEMSVPGRGRGVALAALLAAGAALAGHAVYADTVTGNLPANLRGVAEGQAVTTDLGGNAKAVTYWANRPEGAVVVTTVDTVTGADTDGEQHAIVRLQSTLQPGQAQEVSVPLGAGQEQPVLRIERTADRVSVSKVSE